MAKYLFMIKPATYAACSVLSLVKFLDRYREMLHASKISIHMHPPYKKPTLILRSHAQHAFSIHPKFCNLLHWGFCTYIHQIKMPISHPENCAFIYIPCICYHKALFHFHQNHRTGLYIYIYINYYEEKAKGAKRGKIHTRPKNIKKINKFVL